MIATVAGGFEAANPSTFAIRRAHGFRARAAHAPE
jgi:hypothetical protein